MRVWSLGQEDPLEEGMAPHASILARVPMDRAAWWATVHRVAESWTRLRSLSTPVLAWRPNIASRAAVEVMKVSQCSPVASWTHWCPPSGKKEEYKTVQQARLEDETVALPSRLVLSEGREWVLCLCFECGLSFLFSVKPFILRVAVREAESAPPDGEAGPCAWQRGCGKENKRKRDKNINKSKVNFKINSRTNSRF